MSKNNLSTNLFKRFFDEKTYINSFAADKNYKFEWRVKSYNVIGKTKDGLTVLDVIIEITDDNELKRNIFKNYSHKDKIMVVTRKRLDNLSDFLGIFVRNVVIG